MATARARKRRTDAAMASWMARAEGFVPADWYSPRNPRLRDRRVFSGELGRYDGFSMRAGRSFVAVLHST